MINRQSRNRSIVFMAVVTASFAVVGTRFWYLQVKEGSHYEALAQADTLRKRTRFCPAIATKSPPRPHPPSPPPNSPEM